MSLSRRNGVYYYWYLSATGKRKKVSTRATTKSKALEFIRTFQEADTSLRVIRLAEFRDEILNYAMQTFSPGWSTVYRLAFSHLVPLCGNIPIAAITPHHADQYKLHRTGKVKGLTVNHELEALRAAFHTAVRWKLLKENPFSCFRRVVVPENKVEYFSPAEFDAFLAAFKDAWFRDLLVFTLHTGLRRSEVVNVKWENIDLERRTILVTSDETFKTKSRRLRVLPMSHEVEGIVSRQPRNGPYVFTYKGRQVKPGQISLKIKRVREEHKMREGLNLQALRHTYATWLVMKGASIYHVSKLLGHSSVTTTQRHYASLETSEMHDLVNGVFGTSEVHDNGTDGQ